MSKKLLGILIWSGLAIFLIAAANVMLEIKIGPSQRLLAALGKQTVAAIQLNNELSVEEKAKITETVMPAAGFQGNWEWGDIGKKLVRVGAIDLGKYKDRYGDESDQWSDYLTEEKGKVTIDQQNAAFWVNTLWALGLTQKSDVLSKGVLTTKYKKDLANFASTAGWTLGSKKAMSLYGSAEIIELTPQQQQRVAEIAANIYRPCCGNSTAFPDCNHGMAILGLIEIMVSQDLSDKEIYKNALAFNTYFFPNTYLDLAIYFKTKQNWEWKDIEPKLILGQTYSSAAGYQNIKRQISPSQGQGGGSCGA